MTRIERKHARLVRAVAKYHYWGNKAASDRNTIYFRKAIVALEAAAVEYAYALANDPRVR